jgi:hypothetical protein
MWLILSGSYLLGLVYPQMMLASLSRGGGGILFDIFQAARASLPSLLLLKGIPKHLIGSSPS